MPSGEALGQEDDAAHVGGPAPVELDGGDFRQTLDRAAGVHGDDDVEGTVAVGHLVDQRARRGGVLQVVLPHVAGAQGERFGVGAPCHLGVVGPPPGGDDRCTGREAVGDGAADPRPAGDAGDKRHTSSERHGLGLRVHDLESSALPHEGENGLVFARK